MRCGQKGQKQLKSGSLEWLIDKKKPKKQNLNFININKGTNNYMLYYQGKSQTNIKDYCLMYEHNEILLFCTYLCIQQFMLDLKEIILLIFFKLVTLYNSHFSKATIFKKGQILSCRSTCISNYKGQICKQQCLSCLTHNLRDILQSWGLSSRSHGLLVLSLSLGGQKIQ